MAEDAAGALPPLFEGTLDEERLDQLFADLNQCAQLLQVQVRATTVSAVPLASFDDARQAMRDGARSAQLRYRYRDQTWCDTLMVGPGGVRLIRIQEDQARTST